MKHIGRLGAALFCLIVTCAAESPSRQSRTSLPDSDRPERSGAAHRGGLQGDDRILHALNRFTFGPRPGDVEAVRKMGLEKWLEAQLHPGKLDESALEAHLALFPAMEWKTERLLYELPSNAIVRQALDGRVATPPNGILHTIYQNQMQRIAARRGPSLPVAGTSGGGETAMEPNGMVARQGAAAPELAVNPESLLDMPATRRLEKLAGMSAPELDRFVRDLRPAQRIRLDSGMTPDQKQLLGALENPERTVIDELTGEALARDIYSNAQVLEVMTDFWVNHFNVYLHKDDMMPYYLVSYVQDTIRPHALGKFEDLLEATAHSPAMLLYLDNASSIGPDSLASRRTSLHSPRRGQAPQGINENYARELMELHTLGVNGGYTQADVIQAARILTGWTVDQPQRGGGFRFNANRHEPGTKVVLGHKFRDSGEQQGRELLHFLATRPSTASFISRELAVRFVSDDPPPTLVDRMAHSWMKSGGDISVVLRTLFHSPEFWSTSAYLARVKTPLEYVVSATRASNAEVQTFTPLANALRRIGMPLYGCVPPNGYSWQSSSWVNAGAMVERMNFALTLAANRIPGIRIDWAAYPNSPESSIQAEEARLEATLLPGGLSASARSTLLEQWKQLPDSDGTPGTSVSDKIQPVDQRRAPRSAEAQEQFLAGLLLGSPAFQRH